MNDGDGKEQRDEPDHAVGPRRERGPGEDPGALAGPERPGREHTRGELLHDLEPYRMLGARPPHVPGAAGITIHRTVGVGRDVDRAYHPLGEHTART